MPPVIRFQVTSAPQFRLICDRKATPITSQWNWMSAIRCVKLCVTVPSTSVILVLLPNTYEHAIPNEAESEIWAPRARSRCSWLRVEGDVSDVTCSYNRLRERKNNADAQQDCEGGYDAQWRGYNRRRSFNDFDAVEVSVRQGSKTDFSVTRQSDFTNLLVDYSALVTPDERAYQTDVLAQGDEDAANGREEAAAQPVKLTALFKGYDPLIRPNFHGKPVAVQMSMTIASIDQVSEVDMDYTVTVLMRQYWNDPRLKFPGNRSMSLDPRLVKKLWVPDTFLENSKSSYLHAVTVDNALIRLFPDGSILYGMRITAKMECEMDLRKYPMDEQSCPFILESYGYTTEDMTYEWREGDKSISGLKDIRLSQFTIYDYKALQGYGDYETGRYPQLQMLLLFRRQVFFFFLQTYIPASLLVIVSWVSFFINPDSEPARVSLSKYPQLVVQFTIRRNVFFFLLQSYLPSMLLVVLSWVSFYIDTNSAPARVSLSRYPQLALHIHMQRNVVFFMLQTYLPCILIVILSWVSFFIDKDSTPARVALGVTTVLTMTTLVSGTRAQLPKISYIKAIDVYLVVCFVFVFAALLEYAAVNYQSRYYKTPRKSRKSKKAEIEEIQLEEKKAPLAVPENDGSAARNGTTRRRFPSPKVLTSFRSGRKIIEDVNDIDKFSRVLFPVTFAVFNAIYWIVYTV
ncbi:Glycine receptor subunit alpha-3 [Branchiostoma belcheri]|nr:Glycine receptor subunit alpha-3 [Branchiostoma belcheri]